MKTPVSLASLLTSLMLFSMLPVFADAPAWPSKPIKLVAVFPPGGSVDQVARVISQPLQDTAVPVSHWMG